MRIDWRQWVERKPVHHLISIFFLNVAMEVTGDMWLYRVRREPDVNPGCHTSPGLEDWSKMGTMQSYAGMQEMFIKVYKTLICWSFRSWHHAPLKTFQPVHFSFKVRNTVWRR